MFKKTREKIKRKREGLELFLEKHKGRLAWGTFLAGFLIDVFTLNRIDAFWGNTVLAGYLFIALFSIVLSNWGDYRDIKSKLLYKLYRYSPLITQFSFGALFSGFVVYYTTSGTIAGSWPFLLVLYLFFIVNEKIQKYYEKFEFQIAVFFLSLFSFFTFFLPIIAKKIGGEIFIASGAISVFATFWIVKMIFNFLPVLRRTKWRIIRNIFVVFIIFNTAYFFRVIPPVPLSIKKIEIVHNIQKVNTGEGIQYFTEKEEWSWMDFYDGWKNTYNKRPGEKVYAFVSVYAPSGLRTEIVHHWQYYKESTQRWITVEKTPYEIIGGRDGGYRGFSYISEAQDGAWRVDVENLAGFLIGRESFQVVNGNKVLELETQVIK